MNSGIPDLLLKGLDSYNYRYDAYKINNRKFKFFRKMEHQQLMASRRGGYGNVRRLDIMNCGNICYID